MGRKDKFTVDYFPHNCNHGKTIFILESRFGNNGYAVWFKTLELLGVSNNHFIDCRNTTDWEFMSAKMQVEPDTLQQIYDLLANLKAIDQDLWENKVIWSQNFIGNLDDVYSRRSKRCMNKYDLCEHLLIKCKQKSANKRIDVNKNPQTKLNYTKQKKTKTNIKFEKFWDLYDWKIKRPGCEQLWNGTKKTNYKHIINDETRSLIMKRLPVYIENTFKDGRSPKRKHPHTYLFGECWNDEVVEIDKKKEIIGYLYECPECKEYFVHDENVGNHTFNCPECPKTERRNGLIMSESLEYVQIIYEE